MPGGGSGTWSGQGMVNVPLACTINSSGDGWLESSGLYCGTGSYNDGNSLSIGNPVYSVDNKSASVINLIRAWSNSIGL